MAQTIGKYFVFRALSEEGNREDRVSEDENDYEDGRSNEDEQSNNETEEESTQHAEDVDHDLLFFCSL